MMKRITKIEIDNYRAYITKEVFSLTNGQNLLLYGENGSGKTSLFRAMRHFLESSVNNDIHFENNFFSDRNDGKIEVTFCDYDLETSYIDNANSYIFTATKDPQKNTTSDTLLKTAYRISGFLDYSTLLKVYLNRGTRPNLFELVIELLSDYIPIRQGLKESIGEMRKKIKEKRNNCYHRSDKSYKVLRNLYDSFERAFPDIIKDLNNELNRLMSVYFKNLDMNIDLGDAIIRLNERGRVCDTDIEGEIFLNVTHCGQSMYKYNNSLNEARLSAISICLYLASLKLRNITHDVKILYLDDVFVGLDSSNRRPVIKLLISEFKDYQLFISTYDKSWYLLAREIIGDNSNWEFMELYEGKIEIKGKMLPKPIVISGETDIEMARKYLYDDIRPDYPASANYMRKAFEKLLSKNLYKPAFLNDDLLPTPAYKIAEHIKLAEKFLNRLVYDQYADKIRIKLNDLKSNLKPMLHPLSHYAPDEPIYKSELIHAEILYDELTNLLRDANYDKRCKVVVSKNGALLLQIEGVSHWIYNYRIMVKDNMISYTDADGKKYITDTPLQVIGMIDTSNGEKKFQPVNENSEIYKIMHYNNIEECVNKIADYLKTKCHIEDSIIKLVKSDMFYCIDVKFPKNEVIYDKVLTSEL